MGIPRKAKKDLPRRKMKAASAGRSIALGLAGVIGAGAVGASLWAYNQDDFDELEGSNPFVKVKSVIGDALWLNVIQPFADPPSSKLLPDFPPLPPGMEQPRTLVIALDKLMISSKWNRKEGWVVTKRPGLDRFLALMSQYYEIILWDSQAALGGLAYLEAIDPKQQFFSGMLWRDSTTWRWQGTHGKYTKDLSKINRDLNRVVILETDPNVALQKENMILLQPFVDGSEDDNELLDLVPFLENMCMRNVDDIRDELAKFEGDESIAKAYNAKLAEDQAAERAEMDKGIGGRLRLLRGAENKTSKKPAAVNMNVMPPQVGGGAVDPAAGPGMPGMPPQPVPPTIRKQSMGPNGKPTAWSYLRDYVKDGEEEAKVMFEEWQMYMMQEQYKLEQENKKKRQEAMMKNMPR